MITDSLSRFAVGASLPSDWQDSYRRNLWVTDTLIITFAVFLSQFVWFTATGAPVSGAVYRIEPLTYTWLSVTLIICWIAALSISGSRSERVIGLGTAEYRLVINSALYLFALLAIVSFLISAHVSRGYLLLGFPLGVGALVASRAIWRRQLWASRRRGEAMSKVLVLGSEEESRRIIEELERIPEAGYRVVGVSGPGVAQDLTYAGAPVPFLGPVDDVPLLLESTGADTVIVASDSALPVQRVREISWQLEAGRQHLIMVPNLTDIGGPRIHTRPVAGLPLMHVETPRFTGRQRFLKRGIDIVASGLLLVLLSPLFLVLAFLVKASGPGTVFYRQERIGYQGIPFRMVKFRTMEPDADSDLTRLLEEQGHGDKPLFKVDNDPRVTRIGRVLRRYSLDEFPQLINVFFGDMSLVGPRPQRAREVAFYDSAAERRLIVKPGMSGLWQVSGRSTLTWEESLRLDLYYVENWSLLGDLSIMIRTFKVVFAPGATAQ